MSMRDFWFKATGYQNEACTSPNIAIDLSIPGEDRWIYTMIQTVHPGNNSVAQKTKWLHVREVDPSAPEYKKLAEDLVSSLMVVSAWLSKNKVYEESPGTKMRILELECVTESIAAYREAVGK